MLISGEGLDAAARALRMAFGLDWQHPPFTPCRQSFTGGCGAGVGDAGARKVPARRRPDASVHRMRPRLLAGGHVRRMQQRLSGNRSEPQPGNSLFESRRTEIPAR
jgi:hypothetical protein